MDYRRSCHVYSLIVDLVDELDPYIFGEKCIHDLSCILRHMSDSLKPYFDVYVKSKK